MRLDSPDHLLLLEVQDLYDAEKQLLRSLPKLAKAATHPELADLLRTHTEETRGQVGRLEKIFELLGQKPKSHPCHGVRGLVEESSELLETGRSPLLDVALTGGQRKVEHYEMAAYLSAEETARGLGQKEAAQLLSENLAEEREMDKRLKQASGRLFKIARQPAAEQQESRRGGKQNGGSARKATASKRASNGAGGKQAAGRNGKSGNTTVDHEEIRRWAEARGAKPACVKGTGAKGDTGMIRLDFPGFSGGGSLEEITWDEFFEQFEANQLALVYQDKTARGQTSNFNKLVRREQ